MFQITLIMSVVVVFGTISKLTKSETAWITFHVVQGLQGILVAVLVTCNCQVLKLYTRTIKSRATKQLNSYMCKNVATASLSKSTSLQLLTWEPTPHSV